MSKRTVLFKKKAGQTTGTPEELAKLFRHDRWATKPEKVQRLLAGIKR